MKRVALLVAVIACVSTPAAAQVVEGGYVAGTLGVNVAGKGSVLAGAEVGGRVANKMDLFAELGWVADLPTATRDGSAGTIAGAISAQTGQTVTFDATTPTMYFGVGARYFLSPRYGVHPFFEGVGGFARVKQDVSFIVGGTDVTSNISDFGVTLGEDLAGTTTVGTVGIGAGARLARESWHLDVGYRYTRLFTDSKGTNSNRVSATVAYRF
jgi:hypothetical protein